MGSNALIMSIDKREIFKNKEKIKSFQNNFGFFCSTKYIPDLSSDAVSLLEFIDNNPHF